MDKGKITITEAKPCDAQSVARLGKRTFKEAFESLNHKDDFQDYIKKSFSENQIRSEILEPDAIFIIACLDGKQGGYAKLCQGDSPDCVTQLPAIELSRFYTCQQYWGSGLAQILLKSCMDIARSRHCESIWLSSWKKNQRGNAFYHKMGFSIAGSKLFLLGSDPQEDHVFVKFLF